MVFTPINFLEITQKQKSINLEKKQLARIYELGLETKNFHILDEYKVKNEEVKPFYGLIKKYCIYNIMEPSDPNHLSSEIQNAILSDEFLCLELGRKYLKESKYILVKRVISHCRDKKFINSKFQRLVTYFRKYRKIQISNKPFKKSA